MTTNVSQLDWLIDDLVERIAGANRAVALSTDGLLKARTSSLSKGDAEHLCAAASAFHSLARGTGRHFGGGEVHQTVVEMEHGFLVVTAAGTGACLALLATADADLGTIAYEMNLMITKVGRCLESAARDAQTEQAAAASAS